MLKQYNKISELLNVKFTYNTYNIIIGMSKYYNAQTSEFETNIGILHRKSAMPNVI